MLLQLLFVLIAIIIGARLGGIGLGVLGGLGLAILTFVFGLEPTSPPIRRTGPDGEMGGKIAAQESLQDYAPKPVGYLYLHIYCGNGTCGLFGPSRDSGSGNGNEDTSRTAVGDCCDRVSAGNYGQPDLGGNRSIAQYVVGT